MNTEIFVVRHVGHVGNNHSELWKTISAVSAAAHCLFHVCCFFKQQAFDDTCGVAVQNTISLESLIIQIN